jgi:hypothetical protein
VYSHEEIENNAATEVTLDVTINDGFDLNHLLIGETFDRLTPSAEPIIAKLRGVGRYTFEALQPGLHAIDPDSIFVHKLPAEAALNNSTYGSNKFPVLHRDWYHWPVDYDLYPWTGQYPSYISQTPQGSYALYPQPEEPMLMSFDYIRKLTPMVNYDDVPEALPNDLHMYLVWKAVEEYADFDRNPQVFARAHKHVVHYTKILQRDYLPKFKFGESRFNHYYE